MNVFGSMSAFDPFRRGSDAFSPILPADDQLTAETRSEDEAYKKPDSAAAAATERRSSTGTAVPDSGYNSQETVTEEEDEDGSAGSESSSPLLLPTATATPVWKRLNLRPPPEKLEDFLLNEEVDASAATTTTTTPAAFPGLLRETERRLAADGYFRPADVFPDTDGSTKPSAAASSAPTPLASRASWRLTTLAEAWAAEAEIAAELFRVAAAGPAVGVAFNNRINQHPIATWDYATRSRSMRVTAEMARTERTVKADDAFKASFAKAN